MSIIIKQISEDVFSVKGKTIIKDSEGKWISKSELSEKEFEAFMRHLETLKKEIKSWIYYKT